MDAQNKKLVFLVTELGYFCSHRLGLALGAKKAGYDVTVVANCDQTPHLSLYSAQLQSFELYHLPFHRSRLNPFSELKTLWKIGKAYRTLQPDIVHQVALKPVIYGTLCARLTGVPHVVNALGGMGYLFTHQSLKSLLLRPILGLLFRMLLRAPSCALILQNPDDVGLMTPVVGRDKIYLIRGAGVDLKKFHPTEAPPSSPFKAVMVARLLWSKGIGEIVEAARLLKKEGILCQIQVAGDLDPQNPASVSPLTLATWKEENVITWLGTRCDIAAVYAQSHVAVLPSYREGLPKSLLEAAACGKPIITTDVPGCREVVDAGKNGFLVPPKDAPALAQALKVLATSPEQRLKMGKASRQKAEQEFDEKKIIAQTLAVYKEF